MARGNDSTARRARSEAASRFWRQVLLSVLAISPILFAYIPHFTSPEGHPTGFIAGDMPYYCANGREIFERGNGFAYPNPLDTEPESPVIYFHWYIWILGVAIMVARVSWVSIPAWCTLASDSSPPFSWRG